MSGLGISHYEPGDDGVRPRIIADNLPPDVGSQTYSLIYYRTGDKTWHRTRVEGSIPCTNGDNELHNGLLLVYPLVPGYTYLLKGTLSNGVGAVWDGTKLTATSENNAEFIVVVDSVDGCNQVVYKVVDCGTSTPADEITVPVFYPALQSGNENAHGLTNEGKTPYAAGNGLYYKNIRPVVREGFVQPDGTKWKFEYVDGTPFTIDDVARKYANGTMTEWSTTSNITDALMWGHRLILPHNVVGYTLGNSVTFQKTDGAVVPILQRQFSFAAIFAQADVTLRRQTDNSIITTIEELLSWGDFPRCLLTR